MTRLLLGLIAASLLLYGGLHYLGRQAHEAEGGPPGSGPTPVRRVVQGYHQAEDRNRAALEQTIKSVTER